MKTALENEEELALLEKASRLFDLNGLMDNETDLEEAGSSQPKMLQTNSRKRAIEKKPVEIVEVNDDGDKNEDEEEVRATKIKKLRKRIHPKHLLPEEEDDDDILSQAWL